MYYYYFFVSLNFAEGIRGGKLKLRIERELNLTGAAVVVRTLRKTPMNEARINT